MMLLSEVVGQIAERGIRLHRLTGDSLQAEGDCPPELAAAIAEHQAILRPFAAPTPEVKAIEDAECIREQIAEFANAIVQSYLPRLTDERLAQAVDTQNPEEVRAEIARLTEKADAIEWACLLFPLAMETEGKHSAEAGVTVSEELADDMPF
jgi:hypothetical protein